MTNHSEWCIKEPGNNCVNCCPTCSNCEEKESEDDMIEQTNYPKRGCMSEDGKYYTHTDGTAWNLVGCPFSAPSCRLCRDPETCGFLKRIAGAYVPSDEEQSACDMARKQIYRCAYMARLVNCKNCEFFKARKCDARLFLAAHQQPDAWEVNP